MGHWWTYKFMDSEADEEGNGHCFDDRKLHKATQYLENCSHFLQHISDVPKHNVKYPSCMLPVFLKRVPNSWTDTYLQNYKHLNQPDYLNILTLHIMQLWKNSDEQYSAHENCIIVLKNVSKSLKKVRFKMWLDGESYMD